MTYILSIILWALLKDTVEGKTNKLTVKLGHINTLMEKCTSDDELLFINVQFLIN